MKLPGNRACGACKKPFVPMEEAPMLYERACRCSMCTRCERDYLEDDPDGPSIAPTDELAELFDDDGICAACWGRITKRAVVERVKMLGLISAESRKLARRPAVPGSLAYKRLEKLAADRARIRRELETLGEKI